jgi:S1-C subfamily serine protease
VDHRPPCDPPNPAIAQLAEGSWGIERELIDYYATHLRALMELGSVWAHKDPHSGRLDGFRLGLARCSLLRQAGLRSGDVVHDVNGHEIHSVLEAVSAYFALRAERHLELDVSRRGEDLRLKYDIHSRKERRAHRRKR